MHVSWAFSVAVNVISRMINDITNRIRNLIAIVSLCIFYSPDEFVYRKRLEPLV